MAPVPAIRVALLSTSELCSVWMFPFGRSFVVAHHVAQLIAGHAAAGHAAASHAVAAHMAAGQAAAHHAVAAHMAAAHAAAGHVAAAHGAAGHAAAVQSSVAQILGTQVVAGTVGGIVLANFLNNVLNDIYKQVKGGLIQPLTKTDLGAFINAASSDVRADFTRRGIRLDKESQLEISRITRDMIEAMTV